MKTLPQRVQELVAEGKVKRVATPYCEKPEFITYYLRQWVAEYKRLDAWIDDVEKIISRPNCLSDFGIELYKLMAEAEKQKRATTKRRITWFGSCYDKVTKGRIFYKPETKGYQDVEAIKAKIDCRDLAEEYMQVRRFGKTARALCPIHDEKTPSFYAYTDGFKCFGCQWSGDCFKFVMEMDKCDFKQALQKLNTTNV